MTMNTCILFALSNKYVLANTDLIYVYIMIHNQSIVTIGFDKYIYLQPTENLTNELPVL